ncbi:hypothetical protein [Foetidibacter luteolus]|uniref:hypothetical protein n=1 Tax=Foetidibacter luteolus TaxID=2608880 RepID=UPI00129BA1C1|nr:hypothetical protein [Foetidibacter luteolus]
MNITASILQRILVNHFYKVNAGFFLFLFFVLFGIPVPAAGFHFALINGILDSYVFLLLVFAAWLLYNLKCINYIIQQLRHERQSFLFVVNQNSPVKVMLYMLFVQAMVYLPAIAYATAIVIIAISRHLYLMAILVCLFNALICIASALVYTVALQRKQLPALTRLPGIRWQPGKPLFSMPFFFAWHNRAQMLLVTKTFSLLLLYGFIRLYNPDHYDIRPLLLVCMLSATAHSALVFQVREFEEEYLSFVRGLPITLLKRCLNLVASCWLFILPEMLFLWTGYPLYFTIADYFQLVLMMTALLCFYHAVLLTANFTMDSYLRTVFGILAGLFFIVLYNPGIILPCILLAISLVLYGSYYYAYEKKC